MNGIVSIPLLIGLGLGSFDAPAFAHGDDHGNADAVTASKVVQTPFGIAGGARKPSRTLDVVMSDEMRFDPGVITVAEGETIRFRVRNQGRTAHEMVLGTAKELKAHAAMMMQSADMAHDTANAVRVEPGATGEMVWTFNRPGEFTYACLVPGHFEAGMTGKAIVKRR